MMKNKIIILIFNKLNSNKIKLIIYNNKINFLIDNLNIIKKHYFKIFY